MVQSPTGEAPDAGRTLPSGRAWSIALGAVDQHAWGARSLSSVALQPADPRYLQPDLDAVHEPGRERRNAARVHRLPGPRRSAARKAARNLAGRSLQFDFDANAAPAAKFNRLLTLTFMSRSDASRIIK